MSRVTGHTQSKLIYTLAFICLLVTAQFLAARHSPAHIFGVPAQEKGENENSCGLCLASHALGAAVMTAVVLVFMLFRPQFDRKHETPRFAVFFAKSFFATGPPPALI